MNKRDFNPMADLPKCDICGASMISMDTVLPTGSDIQLHVTVSFACGSVWRTFQRLQFTRSLESVPNGRYTVYDPKPAGFTEDIPCKNAARIARKLRAEHAERDLS